MHEGHRERMRQKLTAAPESLADHELLEIMLYAVYKRGNTNGIAHELLNTFGSLDGVLSAGVESLIQVRGVGDCAAAFLKSTGMVFERIRERKTALPAYTSPFEFKNFLTEKFSRLREETVIVYFLSKAHNILSEFHFSNRNENNVNIDLAEIGRKINLSKPYAAIVTHNHISGSAQPTHKDDLATKSLSQLFFLYNVQFYDHIIIAGKNYYSYEMSGKLAEIKRTSRFDESII